MRKLYFSWIDIEYINDNILIQFQMLAFNQTFKNKNNLNIYTTRNNTDQLYEPLRAILRKSNLQLGYLSSDKRSDQINKSPHGKKMRIISPTEAENIKNGIFIPVNKELVPTRNLQKIIGKKFTPVDFTEKIGQPLSPEQFNMMRQGAVSQIVYEIQEQQQKYDYYTRGSLLYTKSSIPYKSEVQQLPKPLFIGHSSKDLIQGRQLSLSLANSPTESFNYKGSPPKPYHFKQSMRAIQQSKVPKNQYKYNLSTINHSSGFALCQKGCFSQNDTTDLSIKDQ